MTLEEIENAWEKDSKIDQTELTKESLSIAELHHKYYKMLVREKISERKQSAAYKILYRLKHEYYTGTLDQETLNVNGWEPWRLRVLKADLGVYFDSDKDLIGSLLTLTEHQQKCEFLESIIKNISNRGFQIKNAIDFLKFTNGLNY